MKTLAALLYVLVLFFLLMLFNGCSPVGEDPDLHPYIYNPEPEALETFQAARDRIYAAAGVFLREDPKGVPVRFVDRSEIDNDCGWTPITFRPAPFEVVDLEVRIGAYGDQSRCRDAEDTMVHELIHALRRDLLLEDNASGDHGHSQTGVFQRSGGDGSLNEDSLNHLCEAVTCSIYNPEK